MWQAKALSEQAAAVTLHAAPTRRGRGTGVGRGARRRRRRRPGGVHVVSVRGLLPPHHGSGDVVELRVPRLPPQAGLRRAPPLLAPLPLRRVLRCGRRGRRCHGVPRVPVRADEQRRGHPLLSRAFPASSSRSGMQQQPTLAAGYLLAPKGNMAIN